MKNGQCLSILKGLKRVDIQGMPIRFNYAVSKNIDILERHVNQMQKKIRISAEYDKFLDEKEELNIKFSEKDENGKPKKTVVNVDANGKGNEAYIVDGDGVPDSKYTKAMISLSEKHEKAIKARSKQVADYNKMLEEDVSKDLKFKFIDIDIVPDGIPRAGMDALYHFINEPTD